MQPILHTTPTTNIYIPGLGRPEQGELPPACYQRRIRGLTDEEVAHLPALPKEHPQQQAWHHRQIACRRLLEYLALKNKCLSILEVGCGNGWLSSQLASIPGVKVLGLESDLTVLRQAARVFRHLPNLKFMCGDFYSDIMTGLTFDIIVFNGGIRQFPALNDILSAALLRLRAEGEIHILGTALQRKELKIFTWRRLFSPRSLLSRIMGRSAQSPWIRVSNYRLNG